MTEPTNPQHPLIHDRGRGPELIGTRVTVYNLFPDLLQGTRTEASIAAEYDISTEQVAAMRAYILANYADVAAKNAAIDERIRRQIEAQHNDPVFLAKVAQTRAHFQLLREWMAEQRALGRPPLPEPPGWRAEFRAWAVARTADAPVGAGS
ncbi:MAG: hypothetical protein ACRC7O_00525 [Fimbriiglobus sp.]